MTAIRALSTETTDAHNFALVADPAVVAVLAAALTLLKVSLISGHDKIRAAFIDDEARQAFDQMLNLLDLAGVMDDSEVLKIAGGIAVEGLQYIYREKPQWFLEGRRDAIVLPAAAPHSTEAN